MHVRVQYNRRGREHTIQLDGSRVERVLGHGHQDTVSLIANDGLQNVAHRWRRSIRQEDVL